MKNLPVAVQVYSVRDVAEVDFKGTMQKIKDMGYDAVELAGLYDLSAKEVKAILDEVGILAISAHVPLQELMEDMKGSVADYLTIGVKYIAVPYLPEEQRPGTDKFEEVVQFVDTLGAYCMQQGIQLLYHNHDFEFVKMPDGRYALDYLYETIAPEHLMTEIDTCWVKVAGEDPAKYVQKYTGRAPVVHLKDYYLEGQRPDRLYALIGIDEDEQQEAQSTFELRPVGYGMQDMPTLLAACIKAGASYVVVEQDETIGRTSLEAIKLSRDYLKELGW